MYKILGSPYYSWGYSTLKIKLFYIGIVNIIYSKNEYNNIELGNITKLLTLTYLTKQNIIFTRIYTLVSTTLDVSIIIKNILFYINWQDQNNLWFFEQNLR